MHDRREKSHPQWIITPSEQTLWRFLVLFLLALVLVGSRASAAPEVGEPAPDFTLPSTSGKSVSLSQFRGNKLVLLEFYIADFGAT